VYCSTVRHSTAQGFGQVCTAYEQCTHTWGIVYVVLLLLCCHRAIAAVYDGLAGKQRLVDEYTSSNRAAQLQEAAAQLESFRERRDTAARVRSDWLNGNFECTTLWAAVASWSVP
jgi:hypothetical protein